MKAILVIDMPKCCNKCPIEETDTIYCQIFDTKADYRNHNPEKERPVWCPLSPINPNMIKALRCVASQDAMKDCYRTRYNRDRKEGEPMMTCKPLPDDLSISCPYQQDEYNTNCEDGECMDWLNEITDMLEGK